MLAEPHHPIAIYAQTRNDPPKPWCHKDHVSSAVEGAEIVASIVMPELLRRGICHARRKGLIHPGPRAPRSRPHHPVFV